MSPLSLDRVRSALAGRYRIDRELAGGGMAIVYLAHDERHERPVALKVMRPELGAETGAARFLAEIRNTARLQHPHILPLLDSGEADGLLYYAMPFVDGESLAARLAREGELPLPDAVRILRDVADALAAAHGQGIVHRDVKPANILLSGRHAFVADFGVAKALQDATGVGTGTATGTATGVAMGTPRYMAPEQAMGDRRTDHRADLYAFGLVAFETLTGALPFRDHSAQALLAAKLSEPPTDVRTLRGAVPDVLAALVTRCLAQTPADRPQTAGEVSAVLESILTPGTGTTAPLPASPAGGPRSRLAVGFTLAVAAGAAAFAFWPKAPAVPLDPERVLVLPFEDRGEQPGDALGVLVADRITQGATAAQLATVIPWRTVGDSTSLPQALSPELERIARAHGAGTVVLGTFHRRGAEVEAVAQLVRTRDGRVEFALRHAATTADSAVAGIEQRVLGALGYLVWEGRTPGTPPPSVEAFRILVGMHEAAVEGDWARVIALGEEGLRSDSTFIQFRLRRFFAFNNTGRDAEAREEVEAAQVARAPVTSAEQAWLDFARAIVDEDRPRGLEAARRGVALDSVGFSYPLLSHAVMTRRPRLALRYLDLDSLAPEARWVARWPWGIMARRMLGEDSIALAYAEAARLDFPDSPPLYQLHARMLAAMDRRAEFDALASEAPAILRANRALVHELGALEAAASGHEARARELLAQALLQRELQARDSLGLGPLGRVLFYSGRYAEAEAAFRGQMERRPALQWEEWIVQARIAQGDTAGARAAAEAFNSLRLPPRRGFGPFLAARIYVALGDFDRALPLLSIAHESSEPSWDWYLDPILQRLRGYAPYEALMRIRD